MKPTGRMSLGGWEVIDRTYLVNVIKDAMDKTPANWEIRSTELRCCFLKHFGAASVILFEPGDPTQLGLNHKLIGPFAEKF
jgi:hypothetical protein